MNFVAIDVETANADRASICQVGLVKCTEGVLTDEWTTYVNPEDYFDGMNVSIHGITEFTVKGAPTFPEVVEVLHSYMNGSVVVSHTPFDRVAVTQVCRRYDLSTPDCTWLDSARVARRTWTEFAHKGYGLGSLSEFLGIKFRHHDALEDARAAACVLLAASKKSGLDLDGCLQRVQRPITLSAAGLTPSVAREGNPDGILYGEVLVFTGALEMPRREAADLAAAVGCRVTSGVTKSTTMLVVGDQDIRRLAGQQKSSKHRKAEELAISGGSLRILRESDFLELVKLDDCSI